MVVRKTGKNGKIEKTGKINKKTNKKPKSESNTQLFLPPQKTKTQKEVSTHEANLFQPNYTQTGIVPSSNKSRECSCCVAALANSSPFNTCHLMGYPFRLDTRSI